MNIIVGAGLAGLLAAHAWPNATIIEQHEEPRTTHKALLRFRTDKVARLTGIDFREVTVRKGIWSNGGFTSPTIQAANRYSHKVLGMGRDRSIWNLDPVQRFIAPDNIHEQLLNAVYNRVEWGVSFSPPTQPMPIVSTAPLHALTELYGIETAATFERSPITVQRWRLPDTDVYQTVYFPDSDTPLYRASITGDIMIAELMSDANVALGYPPVLPLLEEAFGISMQEADPIGAVKQSYGKITDINPTERKRLLFELTHEHQVYSLGRFATWRNILLDDVCDDIAVIKRLSRNATAYDLRRHADG